LLEVDSRLEELEDRLMVASLGRSPNGLEDSWSDEEDEEEELEVDGVVNGTSAKKLQRFVLDYRNVEHLSTTIGLEHPFIASQQPRLLRLKNTIVLDLNTALKQAISQGEEAKPRLIKILGIYRDLGASDEAVKILKDVKSI
jgi:hypothetical protein